MEETKPKKSFIETLATLIVDKRNAFFLAYIGLAVFCFFSRNWTVVNNDLTSYLPEETQTRRGMTIMEDEFITFGTAKIMLDNISYSQAEQISQSLEDISGVTSIEFDDTADHYKSGSALLSITFDGEANDDISINAMNDIKEALTGLDVYISSEVGADDADSLAQEMNTVMLIAVVIIISVLLFTSHTYMEIPVLLLTFGMAAVLNMGTNFIFGEISFVSDSIAVVLQLALAIDYAIILCHRYTEERELMDSREAAITALSKAIPEISGSSLTTISGMIAMTFMHFKIGYDMGIVLIKAILLSLLAVFTLMPGLLVLFGRLIDRTHHKNFVPKITAVGKFTVWTRFVIPPVFILLLIGAFYFSNRCPYVYGYSTLTTAKQNESQIAEARINNTFGTDNIMALLLPAGDYETEGKLIRELESLPGIDYAMGLSNIEAIDDYVLTDKLNPRQFAELIDLDVEVARLLYSVYAADQESYAQIINGLDSYGVPLIDMFMFLYEQKEKGYVTLDDELNEDLDDMHRQLNDAQLQLQGEHYSRILLNSTLPEESAETFAFLNTIQQLARNYYGDGTLLVGNSTNDFDLSSSFEADNILISVLSAVFVILVLLFTFQSAGIPVLLIVVIQGSIWINFSFPYLTSANLFFMSYLVVSSIQMGANIDYAIVITNRYTDLKKSMSYKDAMVEALNQSFPTIVTSGTILATAGILIGQLSSDPAISSIGVCLGRGTLISIALVMAVLPQVLMLGDSIIERTAFTIKKPGRLQNHTGVVKVSGHVRGRVSGTIDADFNGVIHGSIYALVDSGDMEAVDFNLIEDKETEAGTDEMDN